MKKSSATAGSNHYKSEPEQHIYIADVSFWSALYVYENIGSQHCRDPPFLKFDSFKFSEMEDNRMHFDQVSFGCRVRELRKSRNLTQEQLSTALHISIDHLGKIEVGKRGVSIDLLLDLSEALEVSLDFLVKGDADIRTDEKGLIRQMRVLLDQLEMLGQKPD